jgi:hypothetical protein
MERDVPLSAHPPFGLPALPWLRHLRAWRQWPWRAAWPGIALALAALALRLAFISRYPLLYDVDAYGRWLERDHPFSSPWVPLFQVCLYLLTRLADSILAVRLLSAVFGAAAALAFWLLLRRAFGPAIAYLGALLLALNPLFTLFTIVPYQEGLFLSLAFLALWLARAPDGPRWPPLALVTGLAALTRYEGWLLALLLWLFLLWRVWRTDRLTWRFAAASALALGWAPLLWIAAQRNVSPTGIETLAPTLDPTSLVTTLQALWPQWTFHLGIAGGALALGGLLWLGWRATRGSELAALLLAFLAGDLLVLAFLRPFSPGNLRLPLLSLPVVIAGTAGLLVDGGRLLWRHFPWQRGLLARQSLLRRSLLVVVTAVMLLWFVPTSLQEVAAYDALVRPAYLAADNLPRSVPPNATVALLGNGIDTFAFPVYAQQAGWDGSLTTLDPATASAPATLAAALRAAHARILIVYGLADADAGVLALAHAGILLPVAQGPGYTIWLAQSFSASGGQTVAG